MRWTVHGERDLYRDQWVHLAAADVELPDGRHLDHRIIRTAAPGAGIVMLNQRRVLLIWRHRFITDTYGWEIPHGSIRPGEQPADAAVREAEEETGWRPGRPIRPLVYSQPSPGLMTSEHHIFRADSATHGHERRAVRAEAQRHGDGPVQALRRDLVRPDDDVPGAPTHRAGQVPGRRVGRADGELGPEPTGPAAEARRVAQPDALLVEDADVQRVALVARRWGRPVVAVRDADPVDPVGHLDRDVHPVRRAPYGMWPVNVPVWSPVSAYASSIGSSTTAAAPAAAASSNARRSIGVMSGSLRHPARQPAGFG
jgi:8-oxo-dGTP pyrophosphatase MutT (NUDIX family)